MDYTPYSAPFFLNVRQNFQNLECIMRNKTIKSKTLWSSYAAQRNYPRATRYLRARPGIADKIFDSRMNQSFLRKVITFLAALDRKMELADIYVATRAKDDNYSTMCKEICAELSEFVQKFEKGLDMPIF